MVDLAEAARFQIRKAERRIARRERRRAELVARASDAARVLVDEYGARTVWVFGSVLRDWFHEGSDLDLAVEGVAPERFGEAWDRVMEVVGSPVDLVAMEEADERLRQRVRETGEVLP